MISRRDWWRALVGASVTLNLVFVGIAVWDRAGAQPRSRGGFDGMVARMERRLPEADRAVFHAALERQRARFEPKLDAMRATRPAVDAAIAREPFDPAALRAASEAWAARWHDFTVSFGEATAEALTRVSPEARAKFAERRPPG